MNIFWSVITKVGAIGAVIGISFTDLINDKLKGHIALLIIFIASIYACWRLHRFLAAQLRQRYKDGYLPIASFTRFTTSDGETYTYDQFRHIQIKQTYMRSFPHRFVWTGTNFPRVSSDLQKIGHREAMETEHGSHGHCVMFDFDATRIYNDSEVVHIKMEVDDSDQRASPHISQRVESPVRMISFRVELLHATQSYFKRKASLSRRPVEKPDAEPQTLKMIDFDVLSRSYTANIPNPEPGFYYTLKWERPPLPRKGRGKR